MLKKLVLLLLATGCLVGCGKNPAAEPAIKIGVLLELSGSMSAVGASGQAAAKMAVMQINEQGGLAFNGKKIPLELVVADTAANPAQTRSAAEKLFKQDHVLAVVGPNASIGAIPAAMVAEQEKTLLISPWSTHAATTFDEKTGLHRRYVFRACFNDFFEIQALANFARYTKNYKTAAILYQAGLVAPANQAKLFKENFEKLGGKVVAVESYAAQGKTLAAQLEKIKLLLPDVLFLPDYYNGVLQVAKYLKGSGITADLLGSDNWDSPDLPASAGGVLEGAYFPSHYSPDSQSDLTKKFVADYRKLYGKTPDDVAALTYDSFQMLFKAISAAKTLDRQAIRDSLVNLPTIEGVTGAIDFDERSGGEPSKTAMIMQIKNHRSVWVTQANP